MIWATALATRDRRFHLAGFMFPRDGMVGRVRDHHFTAALGPMKKFMLSELRRAFEIGLPIFVPFLIISIMSSQATSACKTSKLPPWRPITFIPVTTTPMAIPMIMGMSMASGPGIMSFWAPAMPNPKARPSSPPW